RLLAYWYAGRGAILSLGTGPRTEADPMPEWVSEMTPEQRAIYSLPGYRSFDPLPTLGSDGERCWIEEKETPHPAIYVPDPHSNIDEKEFYFWDLCGYLVLRSVLSPEDLELANEAIDRFADRIVVGEELARGSQTLAGTGRPTMGGLLMLEEPYCLPFRKMI